MAYKPNIIAERESPALEITDTVIQKGGSVSFNDPHIPAVRTNNGNWLKSVELNSKDLQESICVVLTTNHNLNDFEN